MVDFMAAAKGKTDAIVERKAPAMTFDIKKATETAAELLKRQFGKQVRDYAEEAKKLTVTDDETEKQVISKAGEIKDIYNQIEARRKEIIKDHDQFVRKVNALAKTFKDILEPTMKDLKRKVGDYQFRKELDRREREKKALEEQEKLKEQIKQEAEEKGVEVPEMPDTLPVEKKQTITRTENGSSAHIRTEWAYELVDLSKVPDEYKMLDDKKIKAMIKAGIRGIKGLRIFERPVTVLKI